MLGPDESEVEVEVECGWRSGRRSLALFDPGAERKERGRDPHLIFG